MFPFLSCKRLLLDFLIVKGHDPTLVSDVVFRWPCETIDFRCVSSVLNEYFDFMVLKEVLIPDFFLLSNAMKCYEACMRLFGVLYAVSHPRSRLGS